MPSASVLPHLTASLNAATVLLASAGFLFIRRGWRRWHRIAMVGAMVTSALFLAAYLTYHFTQPILVFRGQGWVRPVYYTLMISHILLAMAVTPMVVVTFVRGLGGRLDRHRALARWTLPLWLYVSVTGIVVYVLLYHVAWA